MGKLSTVANNNLLNHLFNSEYTPPTNLYLCLCTADPTISGTGANCNEFTDSTSYNRVEIIFHDAANRKVVQNGVINFEESLDDSTTAITHWAICDNSEIGAGNMLAFGSFNAPNYFTFGNILYINDGDIEIEITSNVNRGFVDSTIHNLLNLMFRNIEYSSPNATIYLALSKSTILNEYSDSTSFIEEFATDYNRIKINPNSGASPKWIVSTNSSVTNNADVYIITGNEWTTNDWGVDVSVVFVDSLVGGNIICFDNLAISTTLIYGHEKKILTGNLTIGLS